MIAYTRGPPGANGGIWTINRATAPNERPLLVGAAVGEVWELAWSPDGTKIGYISDVGGPFQEELFTVNADGSGVTRLNVDTLGQHGLGDAELTAAAPGRRPHRQRGGDERKGVRQRAGGVGVRQPGGAGDQGPAGSCR